jgi:hypothetical protein
MARRHCFPVAAILFATLHGCALPAADGHCASGITTRLYLGQDTPAGAVTDAQWERFVEDSVTPRFPGGFTVMQGQGRWRSAAGILHEEDTRVIEIVHDNSATSHTRAREVGAAYKRRFVQQAVLVARAPTIQCLYASGD